MDNLRASQPHIIDFLTKSLHDDHLVHAYLFFGGNPLEKMATAKYLSTLILGHDEVTARLVEQGEHANVITIRPDGKNIKKEQIVFLKTEISKKSIENKSKIYLIDGADKMSVSATNSLLKFLEEPAPGIHIILISPSKEVLPATITSRTVNLNFKRSKALEDDVRPEIMEVVHQLEFAKMPVQLITAKNSAIFKDHLIEFLTGYQAYYRCVMDVVLNSRHDGNFDKELLEQSVKTNDIKSCIKKIRAIEEAKRHLQANMNVQLCVDKLWLDFG